MQEMSLWLKKSLWREKQRNKIQILIQIMILGESWLWVKVLEKIIQLGWLEIPTNSLPSQLDKLGMERI